MALIKAFSGALSGTFADQWKEIVTAEPFDELTVVAPGVLQRTNFGRGANFWGSEDVLSNGSKIFVPENTAAFVFSQSGIQEIVTEPGGYEYRNGQSSILAGDGIKKSFVDQIANRMTFGGQTDDQQFVSFVNLREIRGVKFGTRSPIIYNDKHYGADLEIMTFGSLSLKVIDPERFVRNFLPANIRYYHFGSSEARQQILAEFMQSLTAALNALSSTHRISQLPAQAHDVVTAVANGSTGASTWPTRFGLQVIGIGIESLEFTPESRELVKQYSSNRMNLLAFENISQDASNVSAQQKVAQGVQDHGLGDGGALIFGMNLAQGLNPQTAQATAPVQPATQAAAPTPSSGLSFDEQIEAVKKFKELLDAGLLTEEEYNAKKMQIMGL